MPKIETDEDLKKYIYWAGDGLYKVYKASRGHYLWRSVVLSNAGNYVYAPGSWWGTASNEDPSMYEEAIYCKANKRVKMPNPIFAKIKQMSDRFEKRKRSE